MTHYSLKTEYGASDILFKAIVTLDKKRVQELKERGVTLSENVRNVLSNGTGKGRAENPAYKFWFALLREIKTMSTEDFSEIASMLRKETDKPLYYSETLWMWGNKRALEPSFFEVTLKNFDQKRMPKKHTMKRIIDSDNPGCLPICEKHGWLKNPKIRDELIDYASENGKTEAAAWLLEFKNRTADLAAERERAEKKVLRELNAAPTSVTMMRKSWNFEKRADSSIIITGYRGERTEINVPDKIGGCTVTAIGDYAFSPDAYRARKVQRTVRSTITKIILPKTIERIGEFAFLKCRSLTEINLPEKLLEISRGMMYLSGLESIVIGGNIKKIGAVAFYGCRGLKYVKLCEGVLEIDVAAFYLCTELEIIVLPQSIVKIAAFTMTDSPFWCCQKLTAVVRRGSYAEKYCKDNNIVYKYTEE